jgi:hypothetical protein
MKELTFKVFWGGLGDHLLYSPIPRLAKEVHGYDRVLVSNHSAYRNPDTKRLVWELNPYVDGFTDQDTDYPKFAETRQGWNILDEIASFVGLPDDGERYREPEVYHQPQTLPFLRDAIVFDPNSVNRTGIPSLDQVERYFAKKGIRVTHQMQSLYASHPRDQGRLILSGGLQRLCDIIASCRRFICLTTGSATLAAALGKSSTVLYVPGVKPMFHHSRLHSYVNLEGV